MHSKQPQSRRFMKGMFSAMAGVLLATASNLALGGPNLMVFSDDADKDTVPRNSRVFNQVINSLRTVMSDQGFDIYDETATTIKETSDGDGGYKQGRVRRTDAEILDIAQSLKRPPIDVAVVFQIYASAQNKGYTTKVRARIEGRMIAVQSGQFLGSFNVKKSFNAPAQCNRECILESVGSHARILAQDLGDVLSVKLAHMVDGGDSGSDSGGGPVAGNGGGLAKGYTLVFNGFSPQERLDIEEYLVIFSGYQSHRPSDCTRTYCEYWYKSSISSAKLNRNINRMLGQLNMEANVKFRGNTVRVDRIQLRKRRAPARGSDW